MFVRSAKKHEARSTASGATKYSQNARICCAVGCTREVPVTHLKCRQHWYEVPANLRDQVAGTLVAWLSGRDGVSPYLIARLKALICVAKLHGCDATDLEARLARFGAKDEGSL